jgi:hypothetical protein
VIGDAEIDAVIERLELALRDARLDTLGRASGTLTA